MHYTFMRSSGHDKRVFISFQVAAIVVWRTKHCVSGVTDLKLKKKEKTSTSNILDFSILMLLHCLFQNAYFLAMHATTYSTRIDDIL